MGIALDCTYSYFTGLLTKNELDEILETLEEIAMEGKTLFLQAGGKEFHYIACLNERDDWLRGLTEIAFENLGGWLNEAKDSRGGKESKQRAVAIGARR